MPRPSPVNLGLARPFNSDCLENASSVNLESTGRANFCIAARTLTVLSNFHLVRLGGDIPAPPRMPLSKPTSATASGSGGVEKNPRRTAKSRNGCQVCKIKRVSDAAGQIASRLVLVQRRLTCR